MLSKRLHSSNNWTEKSKNGGISQLFFNQAADVPAMQQALDEMGCRFAADLIERELDRLAATDFIPKWIEAHKELDAKAGGSKEEWEEAGAAFFRFVNELFPDNSLDFDYYDRDDETMDCVRRYIREHAGEIFEIVG